MVWSIFEHYPDAGAFAVAVSTSVFAVGAFCPVVRPGVGAVSTQSMTNRDLRTGQAGQQDTCRDPLRGIIRSGAGDRSACGYSERQ